MEWLICDVDGCVMGSTAKRDDEGKASQWSSGEFFLRGRSSKEFWLTHSVVFVWYSKESIMRIGNYFIPPKRTVQSGDSTRTKTFLGTDHGTAGHHSSDTTPSSRSTEFQEENAEDRKGWITSPLDFLLIHPNVRATKASWRVSVGRRRHETIIEQGRVSVSAD